MGNVFSTSKKTSIDLGKKWACVKNTKTGEHLWSCGGEDVLVWHDAEIGDVKHAVPVCPTKVNSFTEHEARQMLDKIEHEMCM